MGTVTWYVVGSGAGALDPPSNAVWAVQAWGGGQSGNDATGAGGNGGGWSQTTNFAVTAGNTVFFNLGAPGLPVAGGVGNGGDTWLSSVNAPPLSSLQGVLAPGGGSSTAPIGTSHNAGGAGGALGGGGTGGGGSAGSPAGAGQSGGAGGSSTTGGGGGGNASAGAAGGSSAGGAGGNGANGTGGAGGNTTTILGGAAGGPGAGGGGGGGNTAGGSGGNGGDDYDNGGGGGGGVGFVANLIFAGGSGGTPGGGGADTFGATAGGPIGQGGWSVIKITYTSGADENQIMFVGSITTGHIPSTWQASVPALAEAWGGGAGGANGTSAAGGGGGGAGEYAAGSETVTPGGNITFDVGPGGAAQISGSATSFAGLVANGGSTTTTPTGGPGGTGGIGTTLNSGGNGGNSASGIGIQGGGGGGAAGSSGAGQPGSPGASGSGSGTTTGTGGGTGTGSAWAVTSNTMTTNSGDTISLTQAAANTETVWPFYGGVQITEPSYWELTVVSPTSTTGDSVGIGPMGGSATNIAPILQWHENGGLWSNGGFQNAGQIAPWTGGSTGQLLGFACNPQTGFIWMRVGAAGLWNNSSSANPVTGAGGIAIPAPLSVTNPGIVVSGTLFQPGNTVTGNFTQASFVGTAPTGFNPLGVSFASIIPASPTTTVIAGTPFTFTGSLEGFSQAPALTLSINQAEPVAMTGVTASGWSESLTIPTSGATTIVVSGGGVSGQVSFTTQAASGTGTGNGGLTPPAQAAAAGFNTLTLGPNIVVGSTPDPVTSFPQFTNGVNWVPYTFTGTDWPNIGFTRNSDGSVTLDGSGQAFGNGLCIAAAGNPNLTTNRLNFTGLALGGGFYVEAVMRGTGPMSFWMNDIETMNGVSVNAGANPWPGQAAGFGDWMEVDIAEFDTTASYGIAMHNWFGSVGSNDQANTNFNKVVLSPTPDFTQNQTYGFLWIPATSTSVGVGKYYFNGTEVAVVTWPKYNPSLAPPPVDNGTNNTSFPQTSGGNSAYSVMDTLHFALIMGGQTGGGSTVTFSSVQVWQASSANNLINGLPPT